MNSKFLYRCLWGLLFLEFVYIALVLLNYDVSWVNPEKVVTHLWILKNGLSLKWEDLAHSLNCSLLEFEPNRISRPLSHIFEIVDTKFRANLWNYIPPHPSLSLLWPLVFIVLPIFLYKFFINMGCKTFIALSGVCLYLGSIGFLGPIVMLFHPAKSMVNVLTVISVWASSSLYKKTLDQDQGYATGKIKGFWKDYLISLGVMFIGFFFDETGLFVYLINAFLLYPVLKKAKDKIALILFLLIPLMYLFMLHVVLPYIHWMVMGKTVNEAHYDAYPKLINLIYPNFNYLWTNFSLLFADHPRLTINYSQFLFNWPLLILHLVYTAGFLLLGYWFFFRKPLSLSDPWARKAGLFFVLMLAYVHFQTFQLSANIYYWGVWWYGSLFSLIYFIALTFVFQKLWDDNIKIFQKLFFFIVLIFVMDGLIFTTYRINLFKLQNLDRNNFRYQDVFNGKINPYHYFDFRNSFEKSRCVSLFTYLGWAKIKHKTITENRSSQVEPCLDTMKKDIYLLIETAYTSAELQIEN